MNPQREKELVRQLEEYDVNGVKFPEAKQLLLEKGYSEAEIVYGLYSAPFDGKINAPPPENPLKKFYEQNPKQADKLAKQLLLVQGQIDWNVTKSYAAASHASPGSHAKAYYEYKLANRLGVPYFWLMALGFGIILLSVLLDLSSDMIGLLSLLFNILIISMFTFKFVQEKLRLNKLKKDARK